MQSQLALHSCIPGKILVKFRAMKFVFLTLFPDMIDGFLGQSILGRARGEGNLEVHIRNLRDWATDKHKSVDDTPYGGGPGMVLRVDVIDRALTDLRKEFPYADVALLTPQGERFTQQVAERIAGQDRDLILIAGHYEGFDERVRSLVDLQLSLGDFVLTGGEIAAIAITDAIARLLPGVLGDDASAHEESHSLRDDQGNRLLEYPHYTRPERYAPTSREVGELVVPEVLKSGDHGAIARWRREQAKVRTQIVDTPGSNR